jgi:hypothetical protein
MGKYIKLKFLLGLVISFNLSFAQRLQIIRSSFNKALIIFVCLVIVQEVVLDFDHYIFYNSS